MHVMIRAPNEQDKDKLVERIVWFHDASHSSKPNFFQKLYNCVLYGKEEGLSFYQKQWEELEATGREEGATQAPASSSD